MPLELWSGIDCSAGQLGDLRPDRLREAARCARHDGLRHLAGLGIRTSRYPVLWERGMEEEGWRWHDAWLDLLRLAGIRPITALLHHGSRPLPHGLLDEDFATGLARHADQVAQRYPWITHWAPVDEPFTTARGGVSDRRRPPLRDESTFLRAVASQCHAALLSMRAIRRHVREARFVQTEDVGKAFGTRPVADRVRYENERRWLSLDLLCGKVDRSNAWRRHLVTHGVDPALLDELATGEGTPDVVGVSHYATSDRFLDHRTHLHQPGQHVVTEGQAYADIEAVGIDPQPGPLGWGFRLREIWDRYGLPIAVNEAHLGRGTPNEQARSLLDAWRAAQQLRHAGVPVVAVTAWAFLKLRDRDNPVADQRVTAVPIRTDLLGQAVLGLARNGRFTHPDLGLPNGLGRSHVQHAAALT